MRKSSVNLNDIANEIKALKGESVKMNVTKGRKRIEKYTGIIENIYPNLFTIKLDNPIAQDYLSFSYNEVLCGQVKLTKIK